MAANPQGSNPFATNNSGGGVGIQTAVPSSGTSQMLPGNQYTPYQQPNWITGGLQNSSMPIQNYPVQNYGRWNSYGGQTNGYGMNQSNWPTASSITQPGGSQPWGQQWGGQQQPPGMGGGMPPPSGGMPPPGTPPPGMPPPVGDNFPGIGAGAKTAHTGGLNLTSGGMTPQQGMAAFGALGSNPAAQYQFYNEHPNIWGRNNQLGTSQEWINQNSYQNAGTNPYAQTMSPVAPTDALQTNAGIGGRLAGVVRRGTRPGT